MSPSTVVVCVSARRRLTLDGIDWLTTEDVLNDTDSAVPPSLLDDDACNTLAVLYPQDRPFCLHVMVECHGFGHGEYQYFVYPLPDLTVQLRTSFYPSLATIANRWNEVMDINVCCPAKHVDLLRYCYEAGQLHTTLSMLRYDPGDYNCLHQDLYGEHVFPLQVVILLSEPGVGFSGDEFTMTEQCPRMQSWPEVVPLRKGDVVVFAVHHRPVQGTRGIYHVNIYHGANHLRSGQRHTMGIIFHDTLQPAHHDHRRSACRPFTR